MKNTFGQAVTLTLFGESHGAAVGAVLDGLAPGLPVDGDFLRRQLSRRRPTTALDTARQEPDNYQILSGVFQGRTTGTPLTIVIPNENTRSGDYTYGLARPSHADYAAYCKYHGYEDWRGGGHFSGRVTAPLVAAGAILLSALAGVGVTVGTHILFGGGCSAVCGYGSDFNDSLRMENGRVGTETNRNGGINGGITNGMDVVFQCAVKPTPSIGQPQQTVDFLRGEDTELTIHGRHDPAIIRRICPVLDSVTALVLCDLLTQRFGTDYLAKGAGL